MVNFFAFWKLNRFTLLLLYICDLVQDVEIVKGQF